MLNAKYLAFGTPNTKNPLSWGVSNAKTFGIYKQYRSKDRTVWPEMLYKNINFLMIFSFLSVFFSSLSLSLSATMISPPTALPLPLTSSSPPPLTNSSPPPLAKQLASPLTPTSLTSADATRQATCFASANAAPSNLPPPKAARSH